MTTSAVWQLAFGLIVVLATFTLAVSTRPTIAIGALLVMIPFQTLDTKYGSSSVLMAYVLAGALIMGGKLRPRMLHAIGAIVLAYFLSLALADRAIFMFHVRFMFQFFSCLVVFTLAYNFALAASKERAVTDVLLVVNVLTIAYCGLQLSVGPGERFVPFGIEQFMFNSNRDPDDPRLVGPFGNPGSTAGYFALMTLVCAFEAMFAAGFRRMVVWLLIGANILGLVATGNRAGFLVLLAMAPLLLIAYRKELGVKRVLQLSAGGLAMLVVAATLAVTYTDFNRLFDRMETVTETEDGIPTTRSGGWPIAIEKIKQQPWFGEGPHFWTEENAEIVGQSRAQFSPGGALDTAFDNYPHSLYLYLLRTVGIVGLIAVVGFFIVVWINLFRAVQHGAMVGYQMAFTKVGLFLIPTFLISQVTLEFHRPETIDYAQFIFALMGMLVGVRDRGAAQTHGYSVGDQTGKLEATPRAVNAPAHSIAAVRRFR